MSKVQWIIENLTKEESYKQLSDAVKAAGYPLIELNGDYSQDLIDADARGFNNCVIFNGSIEMTKLIRRDIGDAYPIAYCDFEKYKCSAYYSHFGENLFNDKYALMSLAELQRQKFLIWGTFGKDSLIFIRPNSGEKTLQAQLLDIIDLDRFVATNDTIKHDLVLVSTPKNIKWEGRFICSPEKIITQSTYRFQGLVCKIPAVPVGATKLVDKILKVGYYPDRVFCVDVCQDSDDNFWLLELTSFSSAGLYASNKTDIVREVGKIVLDDYECIKNS